MFAAGVFNTSPEQIAGVAFVVDKNVEEHYKEAVRYMCQTIRGEKDFTEKEHEVAKPVFDNRSGRTRLLHKQFGPFQVQQNVRPVEPLAGSTGPLVAFS